ncbi:DUF3320 domain-containing protein [Mycolicibacter kumamotonensis]|uniref:DUF3320 domain-containing protein n=1 Tax=Mycolicibacter kumamotonensis TaxID=354243 RepID=UPI000B219575|nr:DUF3320 domain-containing protein [Mycolicibacter kumamotonensis]
MTDSDHDTQANHVSNGRHARFEFADSQLLDEAPQPIDLDATTNSISPTTQGGGLATVPSALARQGEVLAALKSWRDGLVGLTRQSALIKFRASKTSSLLIDAPPPDQALNLLQTGKAQSIRGDLAPESLASPSGEFYHSPRPDAEVAAVVRNLMRKASAEFIDRGLSVLYLAFGILDWCDVDGTEMVSPLLLVPVKLLPNGPKSTPLITVGEDDAVLNPALALRLKEFGIDLPAIEEIDNLSVSETLTAIRSVLANHDAFTGWTLRETTYLSTFSFTKEAMFRDLLDNEARILEHPIVRALATSDPSQQSAAFQFDRLEDADIDRAAPPELTPLVLDADSSQRAAVAAALAGKTFVMDGPPGTGKSQTIANMIGALLHAGKTVLFVSEKMAALEVVRNRLASVGLGSYLLELHSHKANRKEVATELLNTLDNVVKPPVAMPGATRLGVRDRRDQLNQYATAMNEVRKPLNMPLHKVLGLCANLAAAPIAPVPETDPTGLSEADYVGIQETLSKLVRAWRPAVQGNSFLWREVIDDQSLEVRLYHAKSALEELRSTVALNTELVDAFCLTKPSDAPQLLALIQHQHGPRPAGVMDQWLTAESTVPLDSLRADLGRQLAHLRVAEETVVKVGGVAWTSFPDLATMPPEPPPVGASPFPVEIHTMPARDLMATADRFEAQARMLDQRLNALSALADSIGLAPPSTFADADRLMRLVRLRSHNALPDRRWFTRSGLTEARAAAAVMRERIRALNEAEAKASPVFAPEALSAPLAELQDRFTNLHKGLKKLSGNYRADKKTLAGLLTDAAEVKTGISHLSDAIAWGDAVKALNTFTATGGEILGAHVAGRETDFEKLNAAFNVADEVLTILDGKVPAQLVTYMTGTGSNDAYQTVADTVRHDFDEWKSGLQVSPAATGRPELLIGAIREAINWLTAHVSPLRRAADRVGAVAAVAAGGADSLADANNLLALVDDAKRAAVEIRRGEPAYRNTFGDHFDFSETNLESLDEAMTWATHLRYLAGGPLTTDQVKAIAGSSLVEALGPAHEKWVNTCGRVVEAFAPSRQRELMTEFDDYNDAVELLDAFREDSVGQQEWFEYRRAYADLARRGLDVAVDFCIEKRLAEQDVPSVINRALLRGWCDAVIQGDERLRPLLAADREALVAEYRQLDSDLIKAATADIILAVNARRPVNTMIGEPGVIRREGSKQRKHLPVRELMLRAGNATRSIKPVFMMSPLAVSQYLPPEMEFDIVIFDEASQVTPGDAINCIYRGKALILAGDDKQLPPTSFFDRSTDDDEDETDVKDFQSVLELAKASGAFNNLGLRWHYRSRHEDLIAFSNYKFYGGQLVTFPSAQAEGEDVGIEFFHAHGMYRRGGGAFNPIEAAKVAERVIEHFTKHPELTLGVVTFSVAQADAVQSAIDEARVSRRDLDRFFDTDDRLRGFFIRALEQVQGDERDVIIFSIGYGPDEAGKISTNFGALNKDKGWRRLNVGITRARQRVEVVASMRAREIPPSTNENVDYLRSYLEYAERGPQVLAVPYSPSGRDPESPFEESVLAVIRGWGYVVEPQVGAAGYRIDIGVRHPAYPGMFAIGIECDGYQYHSAPAARDRDRLREQILVGLGWRLHRIWGTAWYRDRLAEEARLRAAIEEAIAAPLDNRSKKTLPLDRPIIETEQAEIADTPNWTTEYRPAPATPIPHFVDPGEAGSHLHMVEAIQVLVEYEGPVHIDVAHERLRAWWNIGRIGSNIRNNIDRAIQRAQVIRDGDFLMLPGRQVSVVRVPAGNTARKAEHVHLEELGMAVVLTVQDVGAARRAEVVQCVARVFGWTRIGAVVERYIGDAIDHLVVGGRITISGDDTLTLSSVQQSSPGIVL